MAVATVIYLVESTQVTLSLRSCTEVLRCNVIVSVILLIDAWVQQGSLKLIAELGADVCQTGVENVA